MSLPHDRCAAEVAAGNGSLIVCRRCGSTAVDHRTRLTIRCGSCDAESPIAEDFAVVRRRWLASDLQTAFRGRR